MRKNKTREGFINLRFRKNLINHSIYPNHTHTNERLAQHNYQLCMDENYDNEEAMKKCKEDKINVFKNEEEARKEFLKEYKKRGVHFCVEQNLKELQRLNCPEDCEIAKKKLLGNFASNADKFIKDKLNDNKNACLKLKKECDDKFKKLYNCNNPEGELMCMVDKMYAKEFKKCKNNKKGNNIKDTFFGNFLRMSSEGNPFQIIYYLHTFFAFFLFGGIIIWGIWWLLLYANTLSGNKLALHFPGRIIWKPLSIYFNWVHRYLMMFSWWGFIGLGGIVVLLYFFKKAFGWWPAKWVWDAIGIFKGSGPPFRWLDSFFGCFISGGPLFCNTQAIWNLIEDWVVVTCKKNVKNCGNKSEKEIREALNAFKTLSDREIISKKKIKENISNTKEKKFKSKKVLETFQNYTKRKRTNKLIEEFYTFATKLDVLDDINDLISDTNANRNENIEDNKEKYEENGNEGQEMEKKYRDEEEEEE